MNLLNIIVAIILIYVFFVLFIRFILPWILVFVARRIQNRISKAFEEKQTQPYSDGIRIKQPEIKDESEKKPKDLGEYVDFEEIPPSPKK